MVNSIADYIVVSCVIHKRTRPDTILLLNIRHCLVSATANSSMAPSAVHDEYNGAADSHVVLLKNSAGAARKWHFDTLQVHSGLEDETAHGQCTLPVYSSASFRFKSSKSISSAYSFQDGPKSQFYMYSRLSNVSSP